MPAVTPQSPRAPSQRPDCSDWGGRPLLPPRPLYPTPFFLPQALLECDTSHGQGLSQQQEHTL